MRATDSNQHFRPGDTLRVARGTYQGAVGAYLGLRIGGDVALEVSDPFGYDLHEGETLCVGFDDVEVVEFGR